MSRRPMIRLVIAAACLGLAAARELRRPATLPVVRLPPASATAPASPAARGLEPDFAHRMTPDDVARGVWALADPAVPTVGPALTADQAAAALPLAREALAARRDVDQLRTRRRAHRAELRAAGAALARALVAHGWTPETAP